MKPFQAGRLVLSSSALADITVSSILLGADCQEAGVEPQPAEAYAYDAVNTAFQMPPIGPGIPVTIALANSNAAAVTVSGALYGTSVD